MSTRVPYNTKAGLLRIQHSDSSGKIGNTGLALRFSVNRKADDLSFDFSNDTWTATPVTRFQALVEVDDTNRPGLYAKDFSAGASTFDPTDEYDVSISAASGPVINADLNFYPAVPIS